MVAACCRVSVLADCTRCKINQVPERKKMQLFITRYFDSNYLNGTQCFGSALVKVKIRIQGFLS